VPVLKYRKRLVSFRLAQEEYSAVTEACLSVGSRSVSDFARQAVLNRVKVGDASLDGDLITVANRLREVESALKAACTLIGQLLGTEQASSLVGSGNSAGAFEMEAQAPSAGVSRR
jgi:hypothetical protein